MQLSKSDALLLSKVLFHYEKLTRYDADSLDEVDGIYDIADRLSEFLTGESLNDKGEGSSLDEAITSDDTPDVDDDESEDEVPEHDEELDGDALHDLPLVDAANGSVEFEAMEDGGVDVLLNGEIACEFVVALRRNGKQIEMWTEDGESSFVLELKKLNKAWKSLLKDGVVYKVT